MKWPLFRNCAMLATNVNRSRVFSCNNHFECFLNLIVIRSGSFMKISLSSPGLFLNDCVSQRNNSSMALHSRQKPFKLSDYSCIGFDLDNTICEYKIKPLAEMEYHVLSSYLVEKKGYDPRFLLPPLTHDDIDFMQRGLLLDFEKGNVLKLDKNGKVIKASHGTKMLSDYDIEIMYGSSKMFNFSLDLCNDFTCAWTDDFRSKFRLLLDYFDLPASLGFARAIDAIKSTGSNNFVSVGHDVMSALIYMYSREHFSSDLSNYFKELKAHPDKYMNKCSSGFINWLKEIKKTKTVFLVTGSNVDCATFILNFCIGEEWKNIFDIIVCYARKPGFFHLNRPFLEISEFKEVGQIDGASLKLHNTYSQGNWNDLKAFFEKVKSSKELKSLYIGDNIVEDIYTPYKHLLCDIVAVNEELAAEKIWILGEDHPSMDLLVSKRWGSFFTDDATNQSTLWGSVINKCANLCLPSVNALVEIPLEQDIEFCRNIKSGCDVITFR